MFITESKTRRDFRVSKKALANVESIARTTHRWGDGVPLRLYSLVGVKSVVEAASRQKRELKQQKADQARKAVQMFSPAKLVVTANGNTMIPLELWAMIVQHIRFKPEVAKDSRDCISDLYPKDKLKSLCRDRANLALTCRDLYEVVSSSWSQIAGSLPKSAWEGEHHPQEIPWDQLLMNPRSFDSVSLKAACRRLRVLTCASKPVLIMTILSSFGLTEPSHIPARLLSQTRRQHGDHPSERAGHCDCDTCDFLFRYR